MGCLWLLVVAGGLLLMPASKLGLAFSPVARFQPAVAPRCGWQVPAPEACTGGQRYGVHPLGRLELNSVALRRYAEALKSLQPGLWMVSGGYSVEISEGVEQALSTLEDDDRRFLDQLRGARFATGLVQQLEPPLSLERLLEDGTLRRAVGLHGRFVGDPGSTAASEHPLAVEAERRVVADLMRAEPLIQQLAEADQRHRQAELDALERERVQGIERLTAYGWRELVMLGLVMMCFLVALRLAPTALRRRGVRIAVDRTGVDLDGRCVTWDQVVEIDLTGRQPSLKLVDGGQLRAVPVRTHPRLTDAAQEWAERMLEERQGREVAAEAGVVLEVLRGRARRADAQGPDAPGLVHSVKRQR